jgi:hypothetical protein
MSSKRKPAKVDNVVLYKRILDALEKTYNLEQEQTGGFLRGSSSSSKTDEFDTIIIPEKRRSN